MNTTSFERPKKRNYKQDFFNNFTDNDNIPNIEALSNCYSNYKIFDVRYSSNIMKIIYEYEEKHSSICNFRNIVDSLEDDVAPQTLYYRPKKFYVAQDMVSFKFINFVKSSIPYVSDFSSKPIIIENQKGFIPIISENESEKSLDLSNDISKNCIIADNDEQLSKSGIKVDSQIEVMTHAYEVQIHISENVASLDSIKSTDNDMLEFTEALKDSTIKELLIKFQSLFIDMTRKNTTFLPTEKLLNIISSKRQMTTKFRYQINNKPRLIRCEIIVNENVIIGRGNGFSKKKAANVALRNFHNSCLKELNVEQPIEIDYENICVRESNSINTDNVFDGAEMFQIPQLDNFYLLNYSTNVSLGVLKDAFRFFKLHMDFVEESDRVQLKINGALLAQMPVVQSLSKTKTLLSKFVLEELKKSKWTLLKKTQSLDKSEDSVIKSSMYEKNLIDNSKLNFSTNIGGQLMLKMGWNTDSGLGKHGAGMKDPIVNQTNYRRIGIGFDFGSSKDKRSFSNNVSQYLKCWRNNDEDDIVFDHDFDNTERSAIHTECRKLGLASKSYNSSGGTRYLVVSRFRDPQELFEWVQSRGGKTRLYTALPPGNRESLCH